MLSLSAIFITVKAIIRSTATLIMPSRAPRRAPSRLFACFMIGSLRKISAVPARSLPANLDIM